MNINTRAKALIGAVAIGGAAIAMGGAFTAGGLDLTGTDAHDTFIGGQGEVTITGASVNTISYALTGDTVDGVQLTFTEDLTGKTVAVDLLDSQSATLLTLSDGSCVDAGTTFTCDLSADDIDSSTINTLDINVSTVNTYTPAA